MPGFGNMMIALRLLLLPTLAVTATTGCCGDIPDSFIWTLSLFLLVGFAFAAYSSYPTPLCEAYPPTVCIKILPADLKQITDALTTRHVV